MLIESVRNIVSRSMPIPQPAVGGKPYSKAVQKFSSTICASSSPAALSFACCSNLYRTRIWNVQICKMIIKLNKSTLISQTTDIIDTNLSLWTTGSFSSVYALQISFFITNNSNRSVRPFSDRCHFANGDITCGWSII